MKIDLLQNAIHKIWLCLGIGFWATLSFVRGIPLRLLAWRAKRIESELEELKTALKASNEKLDFLNNKR